MRIRKHSRITALVLALVMILPLISIPTFAEDTAPAPTLNWSQNFDNVAALSDAFSARGTETELKDGAAVLHFAGAETNKYYVSVAKAQSATEVTNPVVADGTMTSGTVVIDSVTYNLSGVVNHENGYNSWVAGTAKTSDGTACPKAVYILSSAAKDIYIGFDNIAKQNNLKVPAITPDYGVVYYSADYLISKDHDAANVEITWYSPKVDDPNRDGTRINIANIIIAGGENGEVYVRHHGDAASKIVSGYPTGNVDSKYIRVKKGEVFNLGLILDMTTGRVSIFVNGQVTQVTLQDALKNGLRPAVNVAQYSRSIKLSAAEMSGTITVDNVKLSTEPNFKNDMSIFAGVGAFANPTSNGSSAKVSNSLLNGVTPLVPPTTLSSVTEDGNTFLKFDYNLVESLKNEVFYKPSQPAGEDGVVPNDKNGDGLVDYHAYCTYKGSDGKTKNDRWEKNANIKSYDASTGKLYLTDGTEIDTTKQKDANVNVGYYADFTYAEKTYKLTDPTYAVRNVFASGAMDKNTAVQIPYVSYETLDKVVLSAKYYIAPNSYGIAQSQLYQILSNGSMHGNGWSAMYQLNLETGLFDAGSYDTGVYCPIGEWFTISMLIDLDAGMFSFYVDDVYAGYTSISTGNIQLRTNTSNYGGSNWILGKMLKTNENMWGKGYIAFDDVCMTPASEFPAETYLVNEDFENPYAYGKAPISTNGIPSVAGLAQADSIVAEMGGTNAWKFSYERVGTTVAYNVDKNSYINHPALDYTKAKNIVLETSYFIDANATGKLQSQFNSIGVGTPIPDLDGSKYKYASAEDEAAGKFKTKTSATWVDLYCIEFYGAKCYLTRESGTKYGAYEMYTGMWNTISLVVDLETGNVQYYVNGVHVFDGNLNATAGESVSVTKNNVPYEKVTVSADKWIVGKVNKIDGKGDVYIDNVKMYEGTTIRTQPTEKTSDVRDFEEFKYSDGKSALYGGFAALPSLTTYKKEANGNMTLRLDMGVAHSEEGWALVSTTEKGSINSVRAYSVAYTPDATTLTYDGNDYTVLTDAKNGLPYIVYNDLTHYIVPNDVAESAAGDGRANVAAPLSLAHGAFSAADQKYVVLAEDLFIEEGSNGIVESQFSGYKYIDGEGQTKSSSGWLQLFYLYMETGLLGGQGGTNMGVKLEIGKWNNLKVVADLEDGVFYIYVNGMLARIYDCGQDNLILGDSSDWYMAKVQRSNNLKGEPYHGGLLIDNVSIGVEEYVYSESYGAQFLTDETFESYTADLLTVVEAASIRFKAPAGLRFGSIVNTEKVEILKKLYGAENTKMGTFITPADYIVDKDDVDSYEKFEDITRADLDEIDATSLNSSGIAYLDIAFDGVYFQGDAGVNLEEGVDYMVGSIVNLHQSNYGEDNPRTFAGMGYFEIVTENGIIGIYTDAILRDITSVAYDCIDNMDLTAEQEELLWCYVDGLEIPEDYMSEVEE